MEKVFEINRNFRNEGLSRQHNPEFTMLEVYQAYGDYNVMMDLTEEIISSLVAGRSSLAGYEVQATSDEQGMRVQFGDLTIDFTRPWRRAKYAELLKEYSGCDIDDIEAIRAKAREFVGAGLRARSGQPHGVAPTRAGIDDVDDVVVVNEVFGATVEDNLIDPTFVIDYPAELCPLARRRKDNPKFAERFELLS